MKLFFCSFLVFLSSTLNAQSLESGLSSWKRGHYSTAIRAWVEIAKAGNASAENNIGYAYEKGLGARQDYLEAFKRYKNASNLGSFEAKHNLAMLYFNGYGVERNYSEAFKLFNDADKGKIPEAQFMIGKMLNEGIGVLKNSKQALNFFLKSAKNNYVNSQFMVGYLFLSGEAGISDPFRARVWAEIADINKYPDAKLLAEYSEYKLDEKKVVKAKLMAKTCMNTSFIDC